MRTDTHKEWTDAFRESFPEEVRPAEGGWEAVAGRMRRAAARRRAAIAAAALALPLAGGGLFLAFRQPAPGPELVAVVPTDKYEDLSGTAVPGNSPDAILSETEGLTGEASNTSSLLADASAAKAKDTFVGLRPPQDDETNVVLSETKDPETETNYPEPEAKDHTASSGQPELTDMPDPFPFPDDPKPSRKPGSDRRLTVGISAGSTAGGAPSRDNIANIAGNLVTKSPDLAVSNSFWNNTSTMILQKEYVHDLPVSVGLNFRYGLTGRIFAESGIEYSYLHSRQDDIHSELHFAGIPLRMDFVILTAGPVELYAGAGGKVEKCLKASLGGIEVKERDLQWSASARIGSQIRLADNVRLYLEPDLSYYFTKTAITTYRTENPLGLTVRAGLRFDINH